MMTSPQLRETWKTVCPPLLGSSPGAIVPCPRELHLTPAPPTPRGNSMQRCSALSSTAPSSRYIVWTPRVLFGRSLTFACCLVIRLQACHDVVEREPYFRLCLSEVCACDPKRACHCNVLTAFARHCAQEGVLVRWRNQTLCREFVDFFFTQSCWICIPIRVLPVVVATLACLPVPVSPPAQRSSARAASCTRSVAVPVAAPAQTAGTVTVKPEVIRASRPVSQVASAHEGWCWTTRASVSPSPCAPACKETRRTCLGRSFRAAVTPGRLEYKPGLVTGYYLKCL